MGKFFKIKLVLAQFLFLPLSIIGQDGSGGTHERWEYLLEDSGDILQFALPVSAGVISLIKKDYDGTKKLALSYSTTIAITYSLKYLVHKQTARRQVSIRFVSLGPYRFGLLWRLLHSKAVWMEIWLAGLFFGLHCWGKPHGRSGRVSRYNRCCGGSGHWYWKHLYFHQTLFPKTILP